MKKEMNGKERIKFARQRPRFLIAQGLKGTTRTRGNCHLRFALNTRITDDQSIKFSIRGVRINETENLYSTTGYTSFYLCIL